MSGYTPAADEVRDQYVAGAMVTGFAYSRTEARTEFDRWLEQVKQEAVAEALEEAADEIERLENIGDTAQDELNEEQTSEYWLYHGTPKTTWLRDRAAQIKGTP